MKLPVISFDLFCLLNIIWIGLGVLTFLFLLRINAPYGRFSKTSWGPMISNRLAWFLMEVPVLLIVFTLTFVNNAGVALPVMVLSGLFCAHYIHRSLIFPLRIHTKGKRMPVVIMLSAIVFNLINGFFIGYFFRNFAHYEDTWLTDPGFILGLVVFVTGAFINLTADTSLIQLRKVAESGYRIPHGMLFRWISCPNHLGEMLEWLGFALMCRNLPAWSFFIWTVANLLPRAIAHHRWYHEKFPEYPAERKAVIPFIL
ncbi:MAG: DUF1295 domain-containing protein [Chitinophagales bacterium]|nr:DUF1295 domain-containing protein [Chitinophagales bacterium]